MAIIQIENEIKRPSHKDTYETQSMRRNRMWVRQSLLTSGKLRQEMRTDYRYMDSKQIKEADEAKLASRGKPALVFNKLIPQVETVAGMQRLNQTDLIAVPRGVEDRLLGDIARRTLRATQDFMRYDKIANKCFDDGTICGLGVFEWSHHFDDADDLLWGDVRVDRINPLSFIWDTWTNLLKYQECEYMGVADWVSESEFKRRWPHATWKPNPGDWLTEIEGALNDPGSLGLPDNLLHELYDYENQRVRILRLWHKEPVKMTLVANELTGQVVEVKNRDEAEKLKNIVAQTEGSRAAEVLSIYEDGNEIFIADDSGNPLLNLSTGEIARYYDEEEAQQEINNVADRVSIELADHLHVIKRTALKPHYCDVCWWQELDSGVSPHETRNYPFTVYVSRQYSDDTDSIQGVIRAVRDAQDEYNKRYGNMLSHLNQSAHSGWLVRKGSCNTKRLELMGARPGIVVEYTTSKPDRMEPSQLSEGHFKLLPTSENNIRVTTGINDELLGQTTQKTVSGVAIARRQQGGSTILQPRLVNWNDTELDNAYMMLAFIQQYFPPEKIHRIIGISERKAAMGPMQQFQDMPEDQIIELLLKFKNVKYDLVAETAPSSPTDRQAQFEVGVEMAGLVTSTGHLLGPATLSGLIGLADLPSELANAFLQDIQTMVDPALLQGANQQVNKTISNIRGGRSGGNNRSQ